MEERLSILINILVNRGVLSPEILSEDINGVELLDKVLARLTDGTGDSMLKQLFVLYEMSNIIQTGDISEKTFKNILLLIKDIVQYDYATIYLIDEKTNELMLVNFLGEVVNLAEGFEIGDGKGLTGWLAKNRKSVYFRELTETETRDYHSFISIPLIIKDQLLGMLNVAATKVSAFSDNDVAVLNMLAGQLALTLERLRYIETIQEQNSKLEAALAELQMNKEKLSKAEQLLALSQLIVGINHEINNPLAVISGSLFLLENALEKNDAKEPYEKYLERIHNGIDKVSKTLQNLENIKKEHKLKEYLQGIKMVDITVTENGNNDDQNTN